MPLMSNSAPSYIRAGHIFFGSVVAILTGIEARLAEGGSAIKYKSPLNVLTDTYDHICYRAR